MISTTVKLSISGSSHSELLFAAEKALSNFFDISVEELNTKISYEIIASEQEDIVDFDDEDQYTAQVIARVKDDRTRISTTSLS